MTQDTSSNQSLELKSHLPEQVLPTIADPMTPVMTTVSKQARMIARTLANPLPFGLGHSMETLANILSENTFKLIDFMARTVGITETPDPKPSLRSHLVIDTTTVRIARLELGAQIRTREMVLQEIFRAQMKARNHYQETLGGSYHHKERVIHLINLIPSEDKKLARSILNVATTIQAQEELIRMQKEKKAKRNKHLDMTTPSLIG
jgi:hypothetical protein